jgi:hypothetical protein
MCTEDDQHQVIATSAGLGSITVCSCGTLTVHVGGVSIRLELSAFVQTAEMFRIAVAQLEAQARALQSAPIKNLSMRTH